MEENNKQNETPMEGETSKKEKDQPIDAGQESVQSTNSDATSASADPKAIAEGFMEKLNEQIQSGYTTEQMDNAICKVVNSWSEKPTEEALNFLKMDYTKYRYIGRKLAELGVPYDKGLDFLKKKYPQENPTLLEQEYKKGYGEKEFNENLRKKVTKKLRP